VASTSTTRETSKIDGQSPYVQKNSYLIKLVSRNGLKPASRVLKCWFENPLGAETQVRAINNQSNLFLTIENKQTEEIKAS